VIRAAELAGLLGLHPPTDEQAAVIESDLAPAVVIAGAGSGKTETMAARVVWLVANRRVAPEAVLGLTFTRKAAAELGKRIRRRLAQWRHVVQREYPDEVALLAELRAGEPTVSTYAAYAGRLVGEQAPRVGAEPAARLLSQAMCWQLADAAVRRYAAELPVDIGAPSSLTRYVLTMAAQFADHLVEPDEVEHCCERMLARLAGIAAGNILPRSGALRDFATSTAHRAALVPLVRDFTAAKAARPAVDFGDQMRIAARLAGIAEVRELERSRFGAVLLDEYQDTGHAQIAMLHALFGQGHPVTAVGDPFQSIYGWRGASAGNIGRFAETFPRAAGVRATVYPLATSFRNDRVILDAANAVAAPLRRLEHVTVALRAAARAGPGTIAVARVETVQDEARWLAARLLAEWDALPTGARTAAVLVRRRAQIPVLSEALQALGLPVEVVGLGGLLTTPEVLDVAATLRVLGDHKPAGSLMRLLTGARWRIGPYDLAALHRRAGWLVRLDDEAASDEREPASIVEALDDLGPPERYSAEGYRRLTELSAELRRLRHRLSAPLSELVADVERTIGVDVEVGARVERATVGRAHLDRFLDEAARFAAESDETSLRAFLAFLDAAEDEENGLEVGEIVVETERVQVLTVHGAKGLEWDIVAVPGLVEKIFPAEPKSINWTRARQELPSWLRGDGDDLPEVTLDGAADLAEVRARLERHQDELVERHAREERRLAYVALTRARTVLLASGFVWDNTRSPREPSRFLTELRGFAPVGDWFEPEPGATNPMSAEAVTGEWPADPLGPREDGVGRRAAVEAGAALVRAAVESEVGTGPVAQGPHGPVGNPDVAAQWRHDVDVLLAERAQLRRGDTIHVELPRQLSVSQLVELHRDPGTLARRLRRPLPMAPAPWTRRGTAFHAWLERRWQAQTLLDVDELPGAADAGADGTDLLALRAAFERSTWANRTPSEVEVPFEMAIGGHVVRGRMDAVFGDATDGWHVVDWKTGERPSGAAAHSAAVQLAAYRLAWARLCGIADADLHTVRAAFHYVPSNQSVAPADLLDAAGLRALVAGPPASAPAASR
jgi:DNA helicase-2/ATP-dependent DNA helicase PcrA